MAVTSINSRQKKGQNKFALFSCNNLVSFELDRRDILSLWSFLTLCHCEFNFLAFNQSFETRAVDCAEVSKDVWSRLLSDKTKSFSFVEPFNRTGSSCHNNFLNLQK
jgi:hypothetical protein